MATKRDFIYAFPNLNNVAITEIGIYRGLPHRNEPDAPVRISASLGSPVMCDLTFEQQDYEDFEGKNITTPLVVFETLLITCQQTKNIVKTPIQGRDGTVKEYIGMGDWMVTIQAIITSNSNGQYPKAAVDDLYKLVMAPIAIPVTSWYLQQLGIYYLVVEDIQVPQAPGEYSQQAVTIQCCSDNPITLQLA